MGLIDVYQASVFVGPDVCGQVCSFRPIPNCTYPAIDDGVEGKPVQFCDCTRYEVEVPEGVVVTTLPEGGGVAVLDPDNKLDFEVSLAASAVLDRARAGETFKVVRVEWDYWRRSSLRQAQADLHRL